MRMTSFLIPAMSLLLMLSACAESSVSEAEDTETAAAAGETAAAQDGATETAESAEDEEAAAATSAAKPADGNGAYRMPTVDERANGVNANCDVIIAGESYKGPCKFDAMGGASFMVERADGYPMTENYEMAVIEADTRLVGNLSVRDTKGELISVGPIERQTTKDACWSNQDAEICAYGKKF